MENLLKEGDIVKLADDLCSGADTICQQIDNVSRSLAALKKFYFISLVLCKSIVMKKREAAPIKVFSCGRFGLAYTLLNLHGVIFVMRAVC